MKKVFWKKLATVLTAVIAVVLMLVAVYPIGFQYAGENSGRIDLDKLKELKDLNEVAKITYSLMLSGIVLNAAAVVLLAVSTIFGRLLFAFDWIIWGGGIFVLLIGIVLLVAGEGYYADKTLMFKDLFNQGVFAAMIICSLVPGLIGVGVGAASFQKKK